MKWKVITMVRINSKADYNSLIDSMKKSLPEMNGTYECLGQSITTLATTQRIKEMFDISDEFEHEFVGAISQFESKEIGPYITEKYFMLIPSLKQAMLQLTDDCIETRRCVIQFPPEHCFQSMQFIVRDNTIHVVCFMRSCDAIKNLPYDIWICSKMSDIFAKYLRRTLNIHPYEYHKIIMMFGSLHVYKEDIKDVF